MFVVQPTSQVVSSGTDVTFTCAIISGYNSTIAWSLGSFIVDRSNERFDIHTELSMPELQLEGIQTTSSLTILNVTGLDSSVVQCFTENQPSGVVGTSRLRAEAVLSVLGECKSILGDGC